MTRRVKSPTPGIPASGVILAGRPTTSARAAQLRANAWGIRVGRDSDEYASLRGAALAASAVAFSDGGLLRIPATAIDDL
jgi:hypothetical protein